VCTGELIGFRDRLGEFETDTSTLMTISCDSMFAQRAFADRDALFFPVLSDFWPHGEVAAAYDVLDDATGKILKRELAEWRRRSDRTPSIGSRHAARDRCARAGLHAP